MPTDRENEGLYFEERRPEFEGMELLGTMMAQQLNMQRDTYGIDYTTLTDDQKIAHFKEMKHALSSEIQEALDEMGWKPWATSNHFNTAAVQAELVDGWHFFMNLMLIAGMTPESLMQGYQAKRLKNIARQQAPAGYDGVSTKCKGCKRALDDDAVNCHVSRYTEEAHCCHFRYKEGEVFS